MNPSDYSGGVTPQESKSLPVHVSACGQRYVTLFNRLRSVERKVGRIELWIILTLVSALTTMLSVLFSMLKIQIGA